MSAQHSETDGLRLYTYWRSTAAYRVRIALNLKELAYESVPVHLVRGGGEQHSPDYRAKQPQGLVPVLEHGRRVVRQSLAIVEYLDELFPEPPLLPPDARERARVRELALMVACDIHPLNNLRVLQYLEGELEVDKEAKLGWYRHWVQLGFAAIEELLGESASTGPFCEGEFPSLADVCLVPQVYNARRFELDLEPYPWIRSIEAHCLQQPAFAEAAPERQPDAEV